MGKIIGGGLPVGALGGRADLLALSPVPAPAVPLGHVQRQSGHRRRRAGVGAAPHREQSATWTGGRALAAVWPTPPPRQACPSSAAAGRCSRCSSGRPAGGQRRAHRRRGHTASTSPPSTTACPLRPWGLLALSTVIDDDLAEVIARLRRRHGGPRRRHLTTRPPGGSTGQGSETGRVHDWVRQRAGSKRDTLRGRRGSARNPGRSVTTSVVGEPCDTKRWRPLRSATRGGGVGGGSVVTPLDACRSPGNTMAWGVMRVRDCCFEHVCQILDTAAPERHFR